MREIKFKFWDTESKVMRIDNFCIQGQSGIIQGKYGEVFKEFIALQFTGLKDKHGAEIYDGDIISDVVQTDQGFIKSYLPVFYCNKEAMFKVDISFSKDRSLSEPLHLQLRDFDFEIVGNIYENPELLNKN